jgi:Kdo2-lipid IVA lauroyltransferase/acyltransferase
MWGAVFVFRQLCRLPWPLLLQLGKLTGLLIFHLARFRRGIVETNLRLCFPERDAAARRQLARAHYQALGIGMFEAGVAWWAPSDSLPPFEIHGQQHLEKAAAEGGVILLTAHFTTLEMTGRLLARHFTLGGLFRPPKNPVVAHLMQRGRFDKLTPAIPLNDLRGLIRALKNGSTIWYAPDQSRLTKFAEILPFFGVPALTNTATSRLAEMTGARVIPFFAYRRDDGSYLLEIHPPLEHFPTPDPLQDSVRINTIFEQAIARAPEQYFWIHRRFKRRGPGYPKVYPKKKKRKK